MLLGEEPSLARSKNGGFGEEEIYQQWDRWRIIHIQTLRSVYHTRVIALHSMMSVDPAPEIASTCPNTLPRDCSNNHYKEHK